MHEQCTTMPVFIIFRLEDKCLGIRKFSPRRFVYGLPSLLIFEVDYFVRDVHKKRKPLFSIQEVPRNLLIQENYYLLVAATLFKESGHYACRFKLGQIWYHYDAYGRHQQLSICEELKEIPTVYFLSTLIYKKS